MYPPSSDKCQKNILKTPKTLLFNRIGFSTLTLDSNWNVYDITVTVVIKKTFLSWRMQKGCIQSSKYQIQFFFKSFNLWRNVKHSLCGRSSMTWFSGRSCSIIINMLLIVTLLEARLIILCPSSWLFRTNSFFSRIVFMLASHKPFCN